jgi:hypothetical protein
MVSREIRGLVMKHTGQQQRPAFSSQRRGALQSGWVRGIQIVVGVVGIAGAVVVGIVEHFRIGNG